MLLVSVVGCECWNNLQPYNSLGKLSKNINSQPGARFLWLPRYASANRTNQTIFLLIGGLFVGLLSVWCVLFAGAPSPAFPALVPPWACAVVGRPLGRPPAAGLGVVFAGFGSVCRLRCCCSWSGVLLLSVGGAAALGRWGCCFLVGFLRFACFFFRFSLASCCFFSYLCFMFCGESPSSAPFPSALAVVRAFGWSRVFGWFAFCVSRVPVSPGLRPSERVAAACPRFASWLCGRLGCSWFVGWSVARACAASLGVSVVSGGVPSGGVQLSLFS